MNQQVRSFLRPYFSRPLLHPRRPRLRKLQRKLQLRNPMHTLLLGIDLELDPLSRRRRRDSAADLLEILRHPRVIHVSFRPSILRRRGKGWMETYGLLSSLRSSLRSVMSVLN